MSKQSDKIKSDAKARLKGELYPVEKRLIEQALSPKNELILASEKDTENDAVSNGSHWKRDREIRSELIRWLCTDASASKQVDPHGIWVEGATITGPLDLSFVKVPFPLRFASCYFSDLLNLYQCEIPMLGLRGSFVVKGILAGHCTFKGDLVMDQGFRSEGAVDIGSAHIEGNLSCAGGTFFNPPRKKPDSEEWDDSSGRALDADGLILDGYALLRKEPEWPKPFQASGAVNFLGAQIQGDFDCDGGNFVNLPVKDPKTNEVLPTTDSAIDLSRLNVKGSVFFRNSCVVQGQVILQDAHIGGNLACEGGTFENSYQEPGVGGTALNLERSSVNGSAFFKPGFSARGGVSLSNARIGDALDLTGSDFSNAYLDLTDATATSYLDSPDTKWPKPTHAPGLASGDDNYLYLEGFAYGRIASGTKDPDRRLEWLALQPDEAFNTDSYEQLAKILRAGGDDSGARKVLRAMMARQVRHRHPYWYLNPFNWLEASIGYGYYPAWAIYYIGILTVVGWIIYRRSQLAGTMVPTDEEAYSSSPLALRPSYPHFSPLALSLENSLPLVELGQKDKWQPGVPCGSLARSTLTTAVASQETLPSKLTRRRFMMPLMPLLKVLRPRLVSVGVLASDSGGESPNTKLSRAGTSPRFVRRFVWIQILLGWLLATLFVAGYTGIIRKD